MSSTSQHTSNEANADPRYLEVLHQYFQNETATPSLARFFEFDFDAVIHASPHSSIKSTWNKRFLTAAAKFNVKNVSKDQPNWDNICEAILKACADGQKELDTASSNSSTTTTTTTGKRSRSTSSSSSKTDSCLLSPSAKARFHSEFTKMSNESKWLLRTNDDGSKVYVEDLMYKHGQNCDYEHAVHSWILDVEDHCWEDVFTAEELETLKVTGNPHLPPIPKPAAELFKKCTDALLEVDCGDDDKAVDALWKAITEDGFYNPHTQPDEEWIQRTLLDYLSLYRHDLVENIIQQGSEMDYAVRFWSNLDKCLDDLALTLRNQACLPTLIRTNAERSSFGVGPIDDQQRSVRPDTLVIKDGIYFALSECGEDLGGIGKKEIVERKLHTPKILKDLFKHALREGGQQEALARVLKVVAWTQNGPRMRMTVLDCPAGYVCRLLHTNEYKMPKRPSAIPASLFPLLKLALKTKAVVKTAIGQIQAHSRSVDDDDPDFVLTPKNNILKLPTTMTLVNKKPRC